MCNPSCHLRIMLLINLRNISLFSLFVDVLSLTIPGRVLDVINKVHTDGIKDAVKAAKVPICQSRLVS